MKNLNLNGDDSSSDIFYNSCIQSNEALKVGDKFHTKEDYVGAMKMFNMENSVDYNVDHIDETYDTIISYHSDYNRHNVIFTSKFG